MSEETSSHHKSSAIIKNHLDRKAISSIIVQYSSLAFSTGLVSDRPAVPLALCRRSWAHASPLFTSSANLFHSLRAWHPPQGIEGTPCFCISISACGGPVPRAGHRIWYSSHMVDAQCESDAAIPPVCSVPHLRRTLFRQLGDTTRHHLI